MKITDRTIIENLESGKNIKRKSIAPLWVMSVCDGCYLVNVGFGRLSDFRLTFDDLKADDWEVFDDK